MRSFKFPLFLSVNGRYVWFPFFFLYIFFGFFKYVLILLKLYLQAFFSYFVWAFNESRIIVLFITEEESYLCLLVLHLIDKFSSLAYVEVIEFLDWILCFLSMFMFSYIFYFLCFMTSWTLSLDSWRRVLLGSLSKIGERIRIICDLFVSPTGDRLFSTLQYWLKFSKKSSIDTSYNLSSLYQLC